MISIILPVGKWGVPLFQVVVVVIAALLMEWFWRDGTKWATLYGGGVSVVNLLWLQWRMRRSEQRVPQQEIERDLERGIRKVTAAAYMSAVERLILVASLTLFGMVKLPLDPMALVIGLMVGQLALLVAAQSIQQPLPTQKVPTADVHDGKIDNTN